MQGKVEERGRRERSEKGNACGIRGERRRAHITETGHKSVHAIELTERKRERGKGEGRAAGCRHRRGGEMVDHREAWLAVTARKPRKVYGTKLDLCTLLLFLLLLALIIVGEASARHRHEAKAGPCYWLEK